jgi:hypothetical protein
MVVRTINSSAFTPPDWDEYVATVSRAGKLVERSDPTMGDQLTSGSFAFFLHHLFASPSVRVHRCRHAFNDSVLRLLHNRRTILVLPADVSTFTCTNLAALLLRCFSVPSSFSSPSPSPLLPFFLLDLISNRRAHTTTTPSPKPHGTGPAPGARPSVSDATAGCSPTGSVGFSDVSTKAGRTAGSRLSCASMPGRRVLVRRCSTGRSEWFGWVNVGVLSSRSFGSPPRGPGTMGLLSGPDDLSRSDGT